MNLASIITPRQVVPDMRARERWSAIEELVDHLEVQNLVSSADKFSILEALQQREDQTTTGIGSGVAIPHAFSRNIKRVVAVLGRSNDGIDFESIDNAPVNLVMLFVTPEDQYHTHLRTLAAIAKMLGNSQVRQRLTEARDVEEMLEIIQAKHARV